MYQLGPWPLSRGIRQCPVLPQELPDTVPPTLSCHRHQTLYKGGPYPCSRFGGQSRDEVTHPSPLAQQSIEPGSPCLLLAGWNSVLADAHSPAHLTRICINEAVLCDLGLTPAQVLRRWLQQEGMYLKASRYEYYIKLALCVFFRSSKITWLRATQALFRGTCSSQETQNVWGLREGSFQPCPERQRALYIRQLSVMLPHILFFKAESCI